MDGPQELDKCEGNALQLSASDISAPEDGPAPVAASTTMTAAPSAAGHPLLDPLPYHPVSAPQELVFLGGCQRVLPWD